ncbi:hypothetical protein KAR91_22785 [Candidatus Pacearchaeota archaeon]|nr:hypothetical protein [Candidatus Pacearchaeota archaeon]
MKRLLIAIVVLVLVTTFVFAQYRTASRQPQKKTLAVSVRLDRIENRLDELIKRIDRLEEKISPGFKLKKQGLANRVQAPLKVDQIVYFDEDDKFKVQQVIDGRNMIVELWIRKPTQQLDRSITWSNVVTVWVPHKQLVWFSGLDTSKWADDSIVSPGTDRLFKITGTKSYDTLFQGIKTLFILEPFIEN